MAEWKLHSMPKKPTRRRIVCPTRSEDVSLPKLEPRSERSEPSPLCTEPSPVRDTVRGRAVEKARSSPTAAAPLTVTVRAMYFSNDGTQADTGSQVTLQVWTSSTVEELLGSVRDAVGCSKGRLLFRMRPLPDPSATLEMCGVHRDPSALHLLISRCFRPQEVIEKAQAEAAELQVAMTMAAAEAAARPKKRRNPQPSQQSPREVVEVSPEELS